MYPWFNVCLLYFSTFLVTDQDGFIVKIDKKHLPKITVRYVLLWSLCDPYGIIYIGVAFTA